MINLQDIMKGLEFGHQAETELKRTGSDKGWKVLADGYRNTLMDLLIEVRKNQPNPDLTYSRLYKLCNQHQWFTQGDVSQYNDMFAARDKGATTHDLAVMIWICSDREKWTVESIQKILDEKMYCAVLHGEIHYIDEYEKVRDFIFEEQEKSEADWEICEYTGRLTKEVVS